MEIKYIVYRQKAEYGWISHLGLKNYDDVLLDRDISNRFLFYLNSILTSAKVNHYVRIPFQSLWFKYYIDESLLDVTKEYIFMFEEGSRPYLLGGYLRYLKKKYPMSHLVFASFNSSFRYSKKRIDFLESHYDFITSFDRKDCKERGWGLYTGIYSKRDDIHPDGHYDSDVYFAGMDKGRLPLLHQIYDKLTAAGLKCEFYITGVKNEDMRKDTDIHYNEWVDYIEVVKKCCKTRCLLDVIQPGQDGETYRQGEAVAYGIKLLSNFQNMDKERYYNPKQMRIFKTAEDIDIDFIKEDYSSSSFPYNGCLDPYKRLEWLYEKLVKR